MSNRKKRVDDLEEPPKRIMAEADVPVEILALPRQFQDIIEALRVEFTSLSAKAIDSEIKLLKIIEDQDEKISLLKAENILIKEKHATTSDLDRLARITESAMRAAVDKIMEIVERNEKTMAATNLEVKTLASGLDELGKRAATSAPSPARMELLESRVKASDSRVEVKRLATALAKLEKQASVRPEVETSDQTLSARVGLLESRVGAMDISAKGLGISAKLVQLESKLKKLEVSVSATASVPVPVHVPVPVPTPAPARGGTGSVPISAPVASASCAPAPILGTAPVAAPSVIPAPAPPSYVEVLRRGKSKPITQAMIDAAADPLELLLAKPGDAGKTSKIVAMVISTKLEKAAKIHPYLTWRAICKGATGRSPLNIVPITPEKVEVFWDASAEANLVAISAGLARRGIVVEQAVITESARGRRLRAYLASYFVLLRQSALDGLADVDKAWVLEQAERRTQGSNDKDSSKVWKKRVARDTLDLGLEDLVQANRLARPSTSLQKEAPDVDGDADGQGPEEEPDADGMDGVCGG